MQTLQIHYLPQFVRESELADSVVVMVDLLRASTTICYALANGADWVAPYLEVSHVLRAAAEYDRDDVVLGGERGGQIIEGFDLGNSPGEYTAGEVFNRTVLFTTTNGAKALHHARLAERVLVGAAVNRQPVVEAICDASRVDVLCAGTNGSVTREDILTAGAIAHGLTARADWQTDAWAESALREWDELLTTAAALNRSASEQFAEELKTTLGGKNLIAIGQGDDLPVCAQLDVLDILPELNSATGEIRPA